MTVSSGYLVRVALLVGVLGAATTLFARPAAAQFSAREGFTPDGAYQWSFELSPYLFLPAVDATIGLNHPSGFDINVNRPRVTVAQLASSLTGAFVGYGLVRYGNFSAELNIDYVAAQQTRTFPPLLPGGPGASLKATTSGVLVSPGIGYQVLPTTADSKFALDARIGFSYSALSASAAFARDPLGGISYNTSFAQPWIGARLSYYPTPKWRIALLAAATGLGVDGGAIGWNSRIGVSYLIAKWFDVTLGYAATQTDRRAATNALGEDRSVNLLAYGPVLAVGFRF